MIKVMTSRVRYRKRKFIKKWESLTWSHKSRDLSRCHGVGHCYVPPSSPTEENGWKTRLIIYISPGRMQNKSIISNVLVINHASNHFSHIMSHVCRSLYSSHGAHFMRFQVISWSRESAPGEVQVLWSLGNFYSKRDNRLLFCFDILQEVILIAPQIWHLPRYLGSIWECMNDKAVYCKMKIVLTWLQHLLPASEGHS